MNLIGKLAVGPTAAIHPLIYAFFSNKFIECLAHCR